MRRSPGVKYALTFMLLGALSMLALISIAWGVWQLADVGPGPEAAPPPDAGPEQAADAQQSGEPVPAEAPPELRAVADEPAKAEPPSNADTARNTAPPDVAEAPADEPEAAEADDEEADNEAREREERYRRELAYMEEKFDRSKARFMEVINTYLDLSMEERPDYLRQAMEDLRLTMEAEREADGMPARPARDRRLFGEMMRMSAERLDEDEKTKVTRFMADVMQMQMARFQAQMEEQLKSGQDGGAMPPGP